MSQQKDRFLLNHYILPAFSQKKVANVSFHDVQSLQLKLKETPYQVNRVLALLSKMFSLAVAWSWRPDNPVKGVERFQEEKRDRWLNDEELQRLWTVLENYNHHLTTYVFKLLLLTGARKGELLQASWDQFDLEKGIWTKPSHLTKQKKKEHLPLSENALVVINELQQFRKESSPYLFPSKVEDQPLKEIKRFWTTVTKEANLENVRIHELRHTHASHLVSSGLSLSIVGKLLGHTQAATTQRYAHLADEPLRQATGIFGDKIKKLTQKS
jgi:integrase